MESIERITAKQASEMTQGHPNLDRIDGVIRQVCVRGQNFIVLPPDAFKVKPGDSVFDSLIMRGFNVVVTQNPAFNKISW